MSFQSQKLRPCLEAIKKNKNRLLDKRDHDCCHARHVTSVNTNYANKKFLCDQFSVYSDIKINPPTSATLPCNFLWRRPLLSRMGLNYYFIKFTTPFTPLIKLSQQRGSILWEGEIGINVTKHALIDHEKFNIFWDKGIKTSSLNSRMAR